MTRRARNFVHRKILPPQNVSFATLRTFQKQRCMLKKKMRAKSLRPLHETDNRRRTKRQRAISLPYICRCCRHAFVTHCVSHSRWSVRSFPFSRSHSLSSLPRARTHKSSTVALLVTFVFARLLGRPESRKKAKKKKRRT